MTTAAIRPKLGSSYLEVADDINPQANDWEEVFVKELEHRSKRFASGKVKTYCWEETKVAAIKKVKANTR